MYTNPIEAFAVNILKGTNVLPENTVFPEVDPCSLCGEGLYLPREFLPFKEFTLALCGHIYHQKCLEKHLVNGEAICPNKKCNKVIETFLSPELLKGSQDKPPTADENTIFKPVDSGSQTPVDEDVNVTVMKELGFLGGEEQTSSKTTEVAKETSGQATSPIEVHVVHYDCVKNSHKMCPTCPSSETMSEVSTLVEPDPSDAQKKRTRESSASTEKSSSKKMKKTGGKKVSSMLKELIEELLTDVPVPIAGENLEEASENSTSIFLQLSERIDHAETKNEQASRGLIFSYFDFGEAVFKRYKELKPKYGKDGSEALVKKEVSEAIPKTKCSDEALRKRTERSGKMYKLFNTIDETKYVMAEVLTQKVRNNFAEFLLCRLLFFGLALLVSYGSLEETKNGATFLVVNYPGVNHFDEIPWQFTANPNY
ncbi:hypothetical protein C1645_802164 [Glomus cerebriforme]|uniref:RING-type domain-containing protein n=1 Tax=Glomus cerebriforme TaxID=658196 RepID=A0A397TEV7_9GLOM|nr:hypothetical protein C1645_802164 [Glomus cerebriforme]